MGIKIEDKEKSKEIKTVQDNSKIHGYLYQEAAHHNA